MSTECVVVVGKSGNSRSVPRSLEGADYISDTQSAVRYVAKNASSSTLVFVVSDRQLSRRTTTKMFLSSFVETIPTPIGTYTQFRMSFIDEGEGDVVHYHCDRPSDIDSAVEQENGAHRCCSLQASTVVPEERAFGFSDARFTVLMWDEEEYGTDLAETVLRIGAVLQTRVTTVCVYFADPSVGVPNVDEYAKYATALRGECHTRTFGKETRISSTTRIQDIREWANMVVTHEQFTPLKPGPYLVNLNPQLVVGERLAHPVSRGRAYIVAEKSNASSVDIVVLPPSTNKDETEHRSIYSPHCTLDYENGEVLLRPECGMTYVNGKLLSEEIPLCHNDRIVLGKEIALRFVHVMAEPPKRSTSRILDWELCCKEFDRTTTLALQAADNRNTMEEIGRWRDKCEKLEQLLLSERRSAGSGSWLVLTNPPEKYSGPVVWPLEWMNEGDTIEVGPQGDLGLFFLKHVTVLQRTSDGFLQKTNSTTKKLAHAARFVVGDFLFLISVCAPASHTITDEESAAPDLLTDEEQVRQVRNALFELQWSVSLLFDLAFPVDPQRVSEQHPDEFKDRRRSLMSDKILTGSVFKLDAVTRLVQLLTEALRMTGSRLALEFNEGTFHSILERLAWLSKATDVDGAQSNDQSCSTHLRDLELAVGSQLALLEERAATSSVDKKNPSHTKRSAGAALLAAAVDNNGDFGLPHEPLGAKDVAEQMRRLRGECVVASPIIARRVGGTVDNLSISANPKAMWERYLKTLEGQIESARDLSALPASKKQSMMLSLVDVLLAYDFGSRNGWITEETNIAIYGRLEGWRRLAYVASDIFNKPNPQSRGNWSHDAAVQRKPTPSLRKLNATGRSSSRLPTARAGSVSRTTTAANKTPSSAHVRTPQGEPADFCGTKKVETPRTGGSAIKKRASSNSSLLMKTCPPTQSGSLPESHKGFGGTVNKAITTRRLAPPTSTVKRRSTSSTTRINGSGSGLHSTRPVAGKAQFSKTIPGAEVGIPLKRASTAK